MGRDVFGGAELSAAIPTEALRIRIFCFTFRALRSHSSPSFVEDRI